VLILIFEIIDLPLDDPHLKTVPQQIGVVKTKQLGVFLMILFVVLEFFSSNFEFQIVGLKSMLALVTILFLVFSNEKRSRYYTAFWVESIPFLVAFSLACQSYE